MLGGNRAFRWRRRWAPQVRTRMRTGRRLRVACQKVENELAVHAEDRFRFRLGLMKGDWAQGTGAHGHVRALPRHVQAFHSLAGTLEKREQGKGHCCLALGAEHSLPVHTAPTTGAAHAVQHQGHMCGDKAAAITGRCRPSGDSRPGPAVAALRSISCAVLLLAQRLHQGCRHHMLTPLLLPPPATLCSSMTATSIAAAVAACPCSIAACPSGTAACPSSICSLSSLSSRMVAGEASGPPPGSCDRCSSLLNCAGEKAGRATQSVHDGLSVTVRYRAMQQREGHNKSSDDEWQYRAMQPGEGHATRCIRPSESGAQRTAQTATHLAAEHARAAGARSLPRRLQQGFDLCWRL